MFNNVYGPIESCINCGMALYYDECSRCGNKDEQLEKLSMRFMLNSDSQENVYGDGI
jgi:hypothetical protein